MLDLSSNLHRKPAGRYHVSLAVDDSEIREAQRLRYAVFAEEMGARLPRPSWQDTMSICTIRSATTCWSASLAAAKSSAPIAFCRPTPPSVSAATTPSRNSTLPA